MKQYFKSGFHPFHLLDMSPWPLVGSMAVSSMLVNIYHYMNSSGSVWGGAGSVVATLMVMGVWWRDVVRESAYQGKHSFNVQKGLYLGVILFIVSEVMFFVSMFYGYFFSALSPDISVGGVWPPVGLHPLSFKLVPLLNTLILLSSGVSITWAHHSVVERKKGVAVLAMVITLLLGSVFSVYQFIEYDSCSFTMADSVYGSLFYMMTGFHGFHVLVGEVFIGVSAVRLVKNHMSHLHHLGFEASAWYWHFVDIVWLFLYVSVYWWGGGG